MDRWAQRRRFRELVQAYRAKHGLRRPEMAETLGLAESTLHNYLYNQASVPGLPALQRAAALFRVPLGQLLDDPASPPAGISQLDWIHASELDRVLLAELFRDLRGLDAPRKEAAMQIWRAGLNAISALGSKTRRKGRS